MFFVPDNTWFGYVFLTSGFGYFGAGVSFLQDADGLYFTEI